MLKLVIGIILALFVVGLDILRQIYNEFPVKEIKRQARSGNGAAKRIYRVAAYREEAELLLFILMGLSAGAALVLLAYGLKMWEFFLLVTVGVWTFSLWKKIPRLGTEEYLATLAAPLIATVVNRLSGALRPISNLVNKNRLLTADVYQTEDLIELIESQSKLIENRIPKSQLKMAIGALTFGEKLVRDVMVPRRMIVSAKPDDNIGPILMEELHKSGHSRFPVMEKKTDKVEGILYLHDLIDMRLTGKVKDIMKKQVFYVHEEFTLDKVFQAFLKTKHHLFIVVNKFEEIVGILTIEDVLEQIIGKQIVDEFDQYEDLKQVANNLAKHEHEKKSTEMIE
jgi:CBS domain containing-hemolysin-like protein